MIFDFSKLRGRIIEKYGCCRAAAEAVNMSKVQLSDRLCNKIAFRPEEIYLLASQEILDIPCEEIPRYFLTPKV